MECQNCNENFNEDEITYDSKRGIYICNVNCNQGICDECNGIIIDEGVWTCEDTEICQDCFEEVYNSRTCDKCGFALKESNRGYCESCYEYVSTPEWMEDGEEDFMDSYDPDRDDD